MGSAESRKPGLKALVTLVELLLGPDDRAAQWLLFSHRVRIHSWPYSGGL